MVGPVARPRQLIDQVPPWGGTNTAASRHRTAPVTLVFFHTLYAYNVCLIHKVNFEVMIRIADIMERVMSRKYIHVYRGP